MNYKEKLLLAFIITLGFSFRFYGINFDQTCCQHPDERAIVMFALPIHFPANFSEFLSPESPLNPHFFAYGNLPLYLLKGSAVLASAINPHLIEYSKINLVGRSISIFADLITIILIFLIGKTLFNNRTGLASAFIYSISVLPIQYSHFYTSDILLTMLITFTLWRVIKLYKNPGIKNSIFVGISFGLALATKISSIPIIISIGAVLLLDFIFIFAQTPNKPKHWLPHIPHVLKKLATDGAAIIVSTIIIFVIAQPYTIIDFSEFLKQNIAQSAMTHNAYTFPYTLQYVGKIPYLYELKNLFLWGVGPTIFIFLFAGLVLLFKGLKTRAQDKKSETIIILSFFFLYFALIGQFAIGFMRYMLPIYPILSIFAGTALIWLFEKIWTYNRNLKFFLEAIIVILLLIWPLSFMSVYLKPNTRLEATGWINKNIPNGSTISVEHWDDRLPLYTSNNYNFVEMTLYEQPDDEIKWKLLNERIKDSDYIILASNRLYKPIQKLGECGKYKVCYPKTKDYYERLFSGKLGFIKVAEFSSYPTVPFINIKINDEAADESFSVYDHPKVIIFKKKK